MLNTYAVFLIINIIFLEFQICSSDELMNLYDCIEKKLPQSTGSNLTTTLKEMNVANYVDLMENIFISLEPSFISRLFCAKHDSVD